MDSIINKLRDDEQYYGEFGQQFLSNSNISTLLKILKTLTNLKVITQHLLSVVISTRLY